MGAFTGRRPYHIQEGRYRKDRGAAEVFMILHLLEDMKSRSVWPKNQITKGRFTEER